MEEVIGGCGGVDCGGEASVKVVVGDERVEGGFVERVGVVFVLDEEAFAVR